MTLNGIATLFNRSFARAFELKRLLCLFVVLVLSGVIILFFQALSTYSQPWLKQPLQLFPLFLAISLIMAGGIFHIRLYKRESEGESVPVGSMAAHSWDLLLKGSYVALPILLAFLLFWVLIGLFMLIKSIPFLGPVLGVILAFAPFLLSLGVLLLFLISLAAFFFGAPSVAVEERLDREGIFERLRANLFQNLLLLAIAYFPVWLVWHFLKSAALMTFRLYSSGDSQLEVVLQALFMLLPLAAILTPAVAFFFNFAYESYTDDSLNS